MTHTIDMMGHLCPAPLEALIDAHAKAAVGDTITITFDCAQATENLPLWCAANGQTVLTMASCGEAAWTISIRKEY